MAVGGRPIGSITGIELNEANQAVVEMKVEDDLAPLHEGTTATIRASSLSACPLTAPTPTASRAPTTS